jgi:hypothetical protein
MLFFRGKLSAIYNKPVILISFRGFVELEHFTALLPIVYFHMAQHATQTKYQQEQAPPVFLDRYLEEFHTVCQ